MLEYINQQDSNGHADLHEATVTLPRECACERPCLGNDAVIELLLSLGADPAIVNWQGLTAFGMGVACASHASTLAALAATLHTTCLTYERTHMTCILVVFSPHAMVAHASKVLTLTLSMLIPSAGWQ